MEENQNEVMENEEVLETSLSEVKGGNIQSFSDARRNSPTQREIFTNITDKKQLFNLDAGVDSKLNDCVGEKIRVKDVLIKKFYKPMKEPVIDEQTGEIIKDTEISMSCVLVDDEGRSYATGSKSFAIQMMNLLCDWGEESLKDGIEIEIIKKEIANSSNKALGFKLV